jgi:tRNA-modifying protein YgfZ
MIAALPQRAVLELDGSDRVAFLQGLVSNDVTEASADRAVWAALLTPQGRWLADFFVIAEGGRLLLDVEAAQAAMLTQRLGRYRMRADVTIRPVPLHVAAAWGAGAPPQGLAARDPRHEEAGWRVLRESTLDPGEDAGEAAYDRHRLTLGLPDGSRDLDAERTLLLEARFDTLHGVSFTKGCYMGQELTARTRYRGLVKRRLLPVQGERDLPPRDTPVLAGETPVGEMRSSRGTLGLALLRAGEAGVPLSAGGVALAVREP